MILSEVVVAQSATSPEKQWEDFVPDKFTHSTTVDNEWFPLKPGTRFVFEGTTVDDGETLPHRLEFTVTDLTKNIGGVNSVVCWVLDYTEDELVEAELAFFAQDDDGNVWQMGEYPEEYDDEKIEATPAWIHGFEDARAGIMMKAKPEPGTASYSQGWGPAVGWTDRGEVYQTGQKTCVPVNCYDDVLVIREFAKEEPNAYQLKYYASGIGQVRVGWMGEGEKSQEMLELVTYEQLDSEAMSEVRTKALELEKSAYKNSKNVYANTKPAQRRSN